MRMKNPFKLAAAALICLPLLFTACASTGVFIGDEPALVEAGGPPPHAPAHGYRAKHVYYYYPHSQVYFDTGRNVYFYMEGDSWRMSVALPNELSVRLGDHVRLELDTDKPYVYFGEHKQKYPPGQAKKANGKKR
jgi:hypothetical protein